MNINDMVSPDGFYSLWCIPSKAEVVSVLVGKYGNLKKSLSVETAEKLVEANIVKDGSLGVERSVFTEAGINFNFVGTWIDIKLLPSGAVEVLERMKEAKCEGYAYLKAKLGMSIMHQVGNTMNHRENK